MKPCLIPAALRELEVSPLGHKIEAIGHQRTVVRAAGSIRAHVGGVVVRLNACVSEDDFVTVYMTTRVWSGVRADLESECMSLAEDGDDEYYEISEIMDRGAACVRRFDGSWPTDEVVSPVTLTRSDWTKTLSAVLRWAEVADQVGHVDGAARGRQAAELIAEALGN